ncbi:MAG: DMT family transporter [Clostridia bacterium]|nr:DMT family transporter [Clostridia bacterium]
MLNLLLNIIFSSAITLWLKYGETKNTHSDTVTTINYLIASLGGLAIFFIRGGANIQQPVENWIMTVVLAIVTGCLYLGTFLLMIRAIISSGAGMCTLWNKAAVLIPIFTSLILWGESPALLGWVGVILTVSAIFIVSYKGGAIKADKFLIALMFCSGMGSTMLKIFQKTVDVQLNDFFVFCTFTTSFIASLIMTMKKSKLSFAPKNLFVGSMVGVANVLSDVFIMIALTQLPAAVVYPVSSSGAISFIAVMSALLFKERMTKKQMFALVLTIIGIVLINL